MVGDLLFKAGVDELEFMPLLKSVVEGHERPRSRNGNRRQGRGAAFNQTWSENQRSVSGLRNSEGASWELSWDHGLNLSRIALPNT